MVGQMHHSMGMDPSMQRSIQQGQDEQYDDGLEDDIDQGQDEADAGI